MTSFTEVGHGNYDVPKYFKCQFLSKLSLEKCRDNVESSNFLLKNAEIMWNRPWTMVWTMVFDWQMASSLLFCNSRQPATVWGNEAGRWPFGLKLMSFALTMMNFVVKMMDFAFKMMILMQMSRDSRRCVLSIAPRLALQNRTRGYYCKNAKNEQKSSFGPIFGLLLGLL